MPLQIRNEVKDLVVGFVFAFVFVFPQDYSILVSGNCVFDIWTFWVKADSALEACVIWSMTK